MDEGFDAFQALGLPRRLVLGEEEIRAAFRSAGKRLHPDSGGDEADFARLQEAFSVVLSPAQRLRHWLGLAGIEAGSRGALPPQVLDLFGMVAPAVEGADAALRRREAARSSLARALVEPEIHAAREAVENAQAAVAEAIETIVARFADLEIRPNEEAATDARGLAFLEKWRAQLRTKFAALL